MEIAVLACGCFWGPEIKFNKLDGVYRTEVGYCGGYTEKTSYREVCTGNTNHAEVVKLEFDPEIISYEKILEFFFDIHDYLYFVAKGDGTHKFSKTYKEHLDAVYRYQLN